MSIAASFSDLKLLIEHLVHLERDALHVHIGLVLFLGIAAASRSPGRFRAAFVWVLVICLIGESLDLVNALTSAHGVPWLGSLKDVVNTMFWPAVLVFAGPAVARLLGLSIHAHSGGGGAASGAASGAGAVLPSAAARSAGR